MEERRLCTCNVGYLREHGGGEVDTLHELQVDVHVEGNLPPSLQLLLLRSALVTGNQTLRGGETTNDYALQKKAVKINSLH